MGKIVAIQIQLELLTENNAASLMDKLETFSKGNPLISQVKINSGLDQGNKYVNLEFECPDEKSLWHAIKNHFLIGKAGSGESLKKSSVIVCQGDSGWDDYLLLHHYNPLENLDNL